MEAGRHALLLDLGKIGFHDRAFLAFLDELFQFCIFFRSKNSNGVLSGHCHERRAH